MTSKWQSCPDLSFEVRRVWRYQRGNQNPYIEEEQTTQWPKEKVQKDKQRSTKHIYKTKDRVKRTPLKTGGKLRCSGRVSSSCSTGGTRRVNLVTNPVISRACRLVAVPHSPFTVWCMLIIKDPNVTAMQNSNKRTASSLYFI
jgi:hypothetical protein